MQQIEKYFFKGNFPLLFSYKFTGIKSQRKPKFGLRTER